MEEEEGVDSSPFDEGSASYHIIMEATNYCLDAYCSVKEKKWAAKVDFQVVTRKQARDDTQTWIIKPPLPPPPPAIIKPL